MCTTTPTAVIDIGPQQSTDRIRAGGAACAVGGLVLAAGAVTTQIAQASTSVSAQLWHYPWSSRTAVIAWAIFGTAQALVLAGVLAWRRSGVAGSSRAARIGLPLAAIGTLLVVAGHFASMPVRDQTIHDTGAQLVSSVFAVGTVLSAAGLLLAGWATLRVEQTGPGVLVVRGPRRPRSATSRSSTSNPAATCGARWWASSLCSSCSRSWASASDRCCATRAWRSALAWCSCW